METKVNLLIACWGGSRYTFHGEYENDRAYYLKLQIDALTRFRHRCQVTFISNGGDEAYKEYLEQVKLVCHVLERENLGISYGAWAAGFKAYPDFTHYIVIEDDYLFVQDDFDQILLQQFEEVEDTGYLASLVMFDGSGYPYAAMSSGMISRECVDKMPSHPGEDAIESSNPMYGGADWQLALGRVVQWGARMGLRGIKGYLWPYDESDGTVRIYGDPAQASDYLIVPARMYPEVVQKS